MQKTKCHSIIVIPARLQSTRLPRKMLLAETGKPLVIHTWEAASRARRADRVLIATDSVEIAEMANRYGAEVCLTDPSLASGTDRVAQATRQLLRAGYQPQIVVNLQGDEPEISPAAIDQLIDLITDEPRADMATLAAPIRCREQLLDPACVKVVFDEAGYALYFSRSPIPHPRRWDDELLHRVPSVFWQHIGIYAFRLKALFEFTTFPPADLEVVEGLEQLRALFHGMVIKVGQIEQHWKGIDTPEDYAAFVARWTHQKVWSPPSPISESYASL